MISSLRPEYMAAELLSRQSAVGTGLWVKELKLPRKILFDTFEHYSELCPGAVLPRCEGCSVVHGDVTLILYHKGWEIPRINYTLAHELGHILLCHTGADNDEWEANRFASALLIPFAPLRALGRVSERSVARFFGCSLTAAHFALGRADFHCEYDEPILRLYRDRLTSFATGEDGLDILCDM